MVQLIIFSFSVIHHTLISVVSYHGGTVPPNNSKECNKELEGSSRKKETKAIPMFKKGGEKRKNKNRK